MRVQDWGSSRQDYSIQNIENVQNGIDNNEDQDEEQVNCPMIFKTCLVGLVTCGILAFVIVYGVQIGIGDSPKLISSDYVGCVDESNVRRLLKSYAYEKIILGLLISAVVISFGLTVFMIYLSYTYCRCFGSCFSTGLESSSQQQSSGGGDIGKYEAQLRKRVTENILVPKQQLNDSYQQTIEGNIHKKRQLKQSKKQRRINHQMGKFRKSREEILRFNQQHKKQISNSRADQFDCQCENCGACVAYCLGCLWCRSCFDAHHYHFYNSKTQQYTYWIAYMVKTFLFGSALAYVIRLYVSLQEVNYCMSDNSKLYANNLQAPMIIGIVTAVVDAFGYIHLFVEGTLLDIVTDTLHDKRKSEHSDHQSKDDQHKKHENHHKSEQSYKSEKNITPKQRKYRLKKQENNQGIKQFQSKHNLFKSDKIQKQKQLVQRDTDSFFIKLKTIGKRYLDNIESQVDQNGQFKRTEKKKEIMSEESYHDNNKKPRIQVPQSFYKLPIKQGMKMYREQSQPQSPSLRQPISVVGQLHQNVNQYNEKQVKFQKNKNESQKSKGFAQYGGFNKNKQQQSNEKVQNENGFFRLRKFSTQF